MTGSLLIVDDDVTFGLMLKTWLGKKGFAVDMAGNMSRARKLLAEGSYQLVLSDLRLPDGDGIRLLRWMTAQGMRLPLIIMTGYADIQTAVEAIKSGADDYISKPVNPDELLKKINAALTRPEASSQAGREGTATPADALRHSDKGGVAVASRESGFLEGESDAARQLYNYVRLVAPTSMSVLITGASGTGKEYVAHRIHQLSKRADRPFIAVDCGAIPKELAASEFFGHVKGAFTGALADKVGAFALADGGTIFLDEIGNLGYEVQVQLLRALQERRIRPVGSAQELKVDVRFIAATNEDLEAAIGKGTFREDLYHRINEFTLKMPGLKERGEDIPLFANFFLDQANRELDKRLKGFEPEALAAMCAYHWPGNLRQMKNMIRRATLLAQHDTISLDELGHELRQPSVQTASFTLHDGNHEKEQILSALHHANNNKSKAAQLLGIDRKTLYNKLKLYGIEL